MPNAQIESRPGNVLERLEQELQMHLERTDRSLAMHEASLAAAARLIHGIRDGPLEKYLLNQDIDEAWTTEAVDQTALMEKPELMAALQIAYGTQDNAHAVLLANRQRIRTILDLIEAAQD